MVSMLTGTMSTTSEIALAMQTPGLLARWYSGGRWVMAKHLAYIDREIVKTMRGDGPRTVIVELPPRHGKSVYVSQFLPAWALMRWPEERCAVVSYSTDYAAVWGRRIREVVSGVGRKVGVKISSASSAATEWETTAGGGCVATGVGGGLTGRGFDLLVIDDIIKNDEEALSPRIRERHWDWWQATASTRLEPGGVCVVMMCMTGDTKVTMANGSEKLLKHIRRGDEVATYENGSISTSAVLNHTSKGIDFVYKITTISGRIIRANERHPFLVEKLGELKWVRVKNLTTSERIVCLTDIGRERLASQKGAKNLLSAKGIAHHTTTRKSGKTGTAIILQHPECGDGIESSTDTVSLLSNTSRWSRTKTESAQSANNHQSTTSDHIGAESSASTIAMTLTKSEHCSATTAILQSGTSKQRQTPLPLLNTFDFTTEQIVSIEFDGVDEVFDVEIERTENFIANGVVSHNTRWHGEDLIGRLLRQSEDDGGRPIKRLRLPAICEDDDCPLGRKQGEALWEQRWGIDWLRDRERALDPFWWSALYQQRPSRSGKMEWPDTYFDNNRIWVDAMPDRVEMMALACDPSKGRDAKRGDYSAIVCAGLAGGKVYVDADLRRMPATEIARAVVRWAQRYNAGAVGIEANGFQELLAPEIQRAEAEMGTPPLNLMTIQNTVNKDVRIGRLGSPLAHDRLRFVRSAGTRLLVEQMREWPHGQHDDGPDALEMVLRLLSHLGSSVAVGVDLVEA